MVVPTELRVLIAVGDRLLVLLPEQLERHALLLQLLVYGRPVRDGAPVLGEVGPTKEPRVERCVVEVRRQWPRQSARRKAAEVRVGRALGEPEAQRDLALAAVLLEPEAEGLTNLAHRDPLSW